GRSRVEKIWRVERERELRVFFSGIRSEDQLGGTRLVDVVTGGRIWLKWRVLMVQTLMTSLAKDVPPLRKKPRIPSAKKTQVGVVPHHQLRLNISLVHIARRLVVGAIFVMFHSSLMQTSLEIMIYSVKWFVDELVHLLRGKESRAVKRGVDSASLTSLEVRMAAAKRRRESSARAKGSSATSAADSKVDKSSPAKDAGASNLLKMNFLSSPSTCAHVVDQIRQAGHLDEDIEEFCPDLLYVQSEQVNVANMEGAEEQATKEVVTEEGGAEEDEADEMSTGVIDQAC
ncbi:unnamed protein product, partial [Prunus brigantina]